MENKFYSVWYEIKNEELKVMNNNVSYTVFAGVGEFINGKLVEPKYVVINRAELVDAVNTQWGNNKGLEFFEKLDAKLQKELNEMINN